MAEEVPQEYKLQMIMVLLVVVVLAVITAAAVVLVVMVELSAVAAAGVIVTLLVLVQVQAELLELYGELVVPFLRLILAIIKVEILLLVQEIEKIQVCGTYEQFMLVEYK
jgi:hypothetical protein